MLLFLPLIIVIESCSDLPLWDRLVRDNFYSDDWNGHIKLCFHVVKQC